MKIWVFACVAFALGMSPVEAAVYTITYSGYVTQGNDDGGFFGAPVTSTDGMDFTAVFNLEYPAAGVNLFERPGYSYLNGAPGTFLNATLTLRGTTVAFGVLGIYGSGEASYSDNYNGTDRIFHQVQSRDKPDFQSRTAYDQLSLYLYDQSQTAFDSADFRRTFSADPPAGSQTGGGYALSAESGARYSAGGLIVTSVSGSPTAAIPEPATWAMFIGGFGLIGAGMRRRRTSISFA